MTKVHFSDDFKRDAVRQITFGTYASEQARLETLKPVVELLAYPEN